MKQTYEERIKAIAEEMAQKRFAAMWAVSDEKYKNILTSLCMDAARITLKHMAEAWVDGYECCKKIPDKEFVITDPNQFKVVLMEIGLL